MASTKLFFPLLALAFYLGCQTDSTPYLLEQPSTNTAEFSLNLYQDRYSKAIADDDPVTALALINRYQRYNEKSFPPASSSPRFDDYVQVLTLLDKDTRDALEKGEYLRYAKLQRTLEQFVPLPLPLGEAQEEKLPTLNKNYIDYALRLFQEEKDGAAYEAIRRVIASANWSDDMAATSEDSLTQILDSLKQSDNVDLYNAFLATLPAKFKQQYSPLAVQKESQQSLLTAVVTILVDQGLKIQDNGLSSPQKSLGSGFFIDQQGYIITNYHVIASEVDPSYEGYSRIYVQLSDELENKIPAKVVGWDKELDLALVKIPYKPKKYLSLKRDHTVEVGQTVSAMGSPVGLVNTVTRGTISNLQRRFLSIATVIQIDVPINPGNSGGALIDQENDVVGIAFAGAPGLQSLNFAIPVRYLKSILLRLYEGGNVEHGWLGAGLFENHNSGVTISYIDPQGPLASTGIKVGDKLLSVGYKPVKNWLGVRDQITQLEGDYFLPIEWETQKDKQVKKSSVQLQNRSATPIEDLIKRDSILNFLLPFFGIQANYIGKSNLKDLQFVVEDVQRGSAAADVGLAQNDSFVIRRWQVLPEHQVIVMELSVKSTYNGYINSILAIPASLTQDNVF